MARTGAVRPSLVKSDQRARTARWSISRRNVSAPSEAWILAVVLADIGGRALITEIVGRTVIIGEGAGQGPRPVIVDVADFVGQSVRPKRAIMMMVVVTIVVGSRLCQARRQGQGGQNDGGSEKPWEAHLDSPAEVLKTRHLRRSTVPIQCRMARKLRKIRCRTGILSSAGMLNEIPTQSG